MKNKNHMLRSSAITVALASLMNQVSAQGTKADNADALNLSNSWVGGTFPTSSTMMNVDTTLTAARSASLGDNLSVLGISTSSGFGLTIGNTAGKTLTIGSSGVALGGTVANTAPTLTLGSSVTLGAAQTWALGTRRLDLTNTLTTSGNALSITGASGSAFRFSNTTLGTDVTIGTNIGVVVPNGTVTINGTNNTNTSFTLFGGATVNIATMGNLGGASSIGTGRVAATGTLNYTGTTFSSDKGFQKENIGGATLNVTQSTTTLSMSGNFSSRLTSHVGGFTLGGAGNLTLSGNIINGVSTTVTKQGAGTLTLSGSGHTYSSTTNVNGGKLTVTSTGDINSTSGVSIGAGEFNYNSSTALSKDVTFSGTGGKISGTGAISTTLNVTGGNTLAVGNNSIGTMSFGSNLTLGGTYLYELTGGGSTADLSDVVGSLTLGGNLDLAQLGFYNSGDKFTLFAYDGSLSGTFSGLADKSIFTDAGGQWQINYNDALAGLNGGSGTSYVTITAIPEPSVSVLLSGLGTLALIRRRRA